MFPRAGATLPGRVSKLLSESECVGFKMSCDPATGAVLRFLVASKPGGRFLEIGTGTGVGTAWMLDGMDAGSKLMSIDVDASVQSIARSVLGGDERLQLETVDGSTFLRGVVPDSVDFLFADFRPGKFVDRDFALRALRRGGIYAVDDLLPQPTWPEDHQPRVDLFLEEVLRDESIVPLPIEWASGLFLAVKR